VTVVQTSVTKTWETHGREPADRQLLLGSSHGLAAVGISAVLAVSARLLVKSIRRRTPSARSRITPSLLNYVVWAYLLSWLSFHSHRKDSPCVSAVVPRTGVQHRIQHLAGRPGLSDESAILAAAWAGVLGITPPWRPVWLCSSWRSGRSTSAPGLLLATAYALALPLSLMAPVIASCCCWRRAQP